MFSWTAILLAQLKNLKGPERNPLDHIITSFEEMMIASTPALGATLGPLIAGFLSDCIGRKKTLIVAAIPLTLGFTLTGFGTTTFVLCLGRFLNGFGSGIGFVVLPMYLGEIAKDCNRGKIVSSFTFFTQLGALSGFALGPFLSVKYYSLANILPLGFFFVVFTLFIPESPVFLAIKKIKDQANSNMITEQRSLEEQREISTETYYTNLKRLLRTKPIQKSLLIVVSLFSVQIFSGITNLNIYMQIILKAGKTNFLLDISSVILGIVQVIASFLPMVLVDSLGRKILFQSSLIGGAISMSVLGLYFLLQNFNYNLQSLLWLPLACILFGAVAFLTGLGPVPWVILSELFPANVKKIFYPNIVAMVFFLNFVCIFCFPLLYVTIGPVYLFWSFAGICFVSFVCVYYFMPETKGLSFEEIQKMLNF